MAQPVTNRVRTRTQITWCREKWGSISDRWCVLNFQVFKPTDRKYGSKLKSLRSARNLHPHKHHWSFECSINLCHYADLGRHRRHLHVNKEHQEIWKPHAHFSLKLQLRANECFPVNATRNYLLTLSQNVSVDFTARFAYFIGTRYPPPFPGCILTNCASAVTH